ncbi:MAG: hypothetical protein JWM42_2628 [Burkholderia sp.]|nr:hypothetical protein [Burkholderia sp.]
MGINQNPVVNSIRHLEKKGDEISDALKDHMRRQAAGEKPDQEEFAQLLAQKMATKSVMMAQFNLHQKPLKTVLNETR